MGRRARGHPAGAARGRGHGPGSRDRRDRGLPRPCGPRLPGPAPEAVRRAQERRTQIPAGPVRSTAASMPPGSREPTSPVPRRSGMPCIPRSSGKGSLAASSVPSRPTTARRGRAVAGPGRWIARRASPTPPRSRAASRGSGSGSGSAGTQWPRAGSAPPIGSGSGRGAGQAPRTPGLRVQGRERPCRSTCLPGTWRMANAWHQ